MGSFWKSGVEEHNASEHRRIGRWTRLSMTLLSTVICGGFIPGSALYIKMFVDAGVASSSCSDSMDATCSSQYEKVAATFNAGAAGVMAFIVPISIAFDRHGGKFLGCWGALLACLGTLALAVIVEAPRQGYDAMTSPFLILAVFITDFGSVANSYCLLSLMWHFQDHHALLFALMNGSYCVGAIIPNLLQVFVKWTGIRLFTAILVLAGLEIVAVMVCYYFCPSKEEYLSAARKALGMPLPKPKFVGICESVYKACRIMKKHWFTHAGACVSGGLCTTAIMMYSSLAGEYAKVLFNTEAAAELLPQYYTEFTALAGGLALPLVCVVIDRTDYAASIMLWMMGALMVAVTGSISQPIWNMQILCCLSGAAYYATVNTYIDKYATYYASPASFGTFIGTLQLFIMVVLFIASAFFYVLGGAADPAMSQALLLISALGALVQGFFCIYLQLTGFPDMPAILPEDEAEIAEPFGCETLDEVAYVLHIENRRELLKEMSKTDASAVAKLLSRIDFERMVSKLGKSDRSSYLSDGMKEVSDGMKEVSAAEDCVDSVADVSVAEFPSRSTRKRKNNFVWHGLSWLGCIVYDCCAGGRGSVSYRLGRYWVGGVRPSRRDQCDVCDCCTDDPESGPLLDQRSATTPTGPTKARLLNDQLIRAVREEDRGRVLELYREEDPDLLYHAYVDLYQLLDQDALDAFENEFEQMFEDHEELDALAKSKPALKVAFLKMMAYRAKKHLFRRPVRR